jgi:3D (Asp-Asp-Asp) domain-containing protein
MRRAYAAVTAGLLAIMAAGLSAHRNSQAYSVPPAAQLQAAGGIPPWPWLPAGVTWNHGNFSAVPYAVNTVQDASLPQGQHLVVHPGTEGTVLNVGGTQTTISSPAPATIANGTAVVHTLLVKGATYHYDRVLSMMTTAYNGSLAMNGPSGAVAAWNGKPLKPGDVAVDPSVIPLGTYLYIDGYGPARAVDTGSAIWGDHVDLFFQESALRIALYGIQFHKVYILTQPPPGFTG